MKASLPARAPDRRPTLIALVCVLVAGCAIVRPDRSIRAATGSISEQLCSAAFVSGVDPERFFAEHLAPEPGMGLITAGLSYQVDRATRVVTARVAGGFESRAIDRDVAGCVLVHDVTPASLPAGFALPEDPPSLPAMAGRALVEPESTGLRAALDHAFAESQAPPHHWTQAVVVAHRGHIVAERYADGYGIDTPLPGNSVTKSIISALVAILVREGKLQVDERAPVAAWADPSDPRHAITIDELLRMTSGLPLDESFGGWDRAARLWFLESDQAAYAAAAPLDAAPGTTWHYSDGGYALLARIVRDRVGGSAADVLRFAHDELFAPLGMEHAVLQLDSTGTPVGSRGMLATARDWTRFGQLFLADGMAGERRILPEGWVKYATTQSLDAGYGAGFWLNVTDAEAPSWGIRWGMPHAPRDAYFARGYLGQYVVVVPSAQLVVARFGASHGPGHDVEVVGQLVADVIAALPG
jgi:CubicO group peptidase (beta-lactamase class C family)